MTKDELDKLIADGKTLDDVIYDFVIDNDDIVDRGYMKDYAIEMIDNGCFDLACHVLNAIDKEYADYYSYDFSMGTLEIPAAITSIEDLYDFVD